jgi:hypothetical protein
MANAKVRQAKKDVQDELQRIAEKYGGLRPSEVVAEAKSKESPIHSEFEWNDGKAAHAYRLNQARTLIRVIVPIIEKADGTTQRDPFVWVPPTASQREESDSNEGVYQPMSVVVLDVDKFARALMALTQRVNAAMQAAEELRDAASATANDEPERMARIALAITALQTAGAAVSALH